MRCAGEEGCRDGDNCLRSLFFLATAVNASVDDDGGNEHTGGVGGLSPEPSIEEDKGSEMRTADRSTFVYEMKKIQSVMLIA